MPSASAIYAAYGSMHDRQKQLAANPFSMDPAVRPAAAQAQRAARAMEALEPLVAAEAAALAAEAGAYLGAST